MKPNFIRVVAIGLFREADRILVFRGVDPYSGEPFCRPLGGGVEFGESAAEALRREIHEELGIEIDEPRLLGVMENRFAYAGSPGHEIVFVFDSCFSDRSWYSLDKLPFVEPEQEPLTAQWVAVADFATGAERLVPEGLVALLGEKEI